MPSQPPAFKAQQNKAAPRWRRTPPAIMPPTLGLWGLAVAWSRSADAFAMPAGIGQLLLGAMLLLFLYLGGYMVAKIVARPGVVADDLKTLPGRTGLAAFSMSIMLLAVALIPYAETLAKAVLVIAIVAHLVFLAIIVTNLLTGPVETRKVTPVFHLTFVGLIVSPLAALQFGWTGYATLVFWLSLAAAVLIWAASALQFAREDVPPPLRPLLAIHLAPASLLGTVALLLGYGTLGLAFGILAIALMAALLVFGRWVTAAGFTPFWGAFTFPLAAFSSLMMILAGAGYGEVFRILGGVALIGATFFIPWVALKVYQLWIKGVLAEKTNSATA